MSQTLAKYWISWEGSNNSVNKWLSWAWIIQAFIWMPFSFLGCRVKFLGTKYIVKHTLKVQSIGTIPSMCMVISCLGFHKSEWIKIWVKATCLSRLIDALDSMVFIDTKVRQIRKEERVGSESQKWSMSRRRLSIRATSLRIISMVLVCIKHQPSNSKENSWMEDYMEKAQIPILLVYTTPSERTERCKPN